MVLFVCAFLVAIVFAVFGQTLGHGFVNLDDNLYVTQNEVVPSGITFQGIARACTHSMCSFYHPLTILSLMLDDQIYGLNPAGFHLTNILLHVASVIVLFLALRKMTAALWPSAFVATIFAIHPLHVESVAWVAERKDVLSGLFFALTLLAYAGYAQKSFSAVRYLVLIFLFLLGLLAKPSLVTLPFVLLLLDYWPLARFRSADLRTMFKRLAPLIVEKIPLFILSAVFCVITVATETKVITPVGKLPLSLQLGNGIVSYAVYLRQMFFPAGLAPFYPYPTAGLPALQVGLAGLLLALICGAVLTLRRRCPYLLTGWLWYLGVLVPMIGIVQLGAFARADRFTYLSQIGLTVMLAFAVVDLTASWRYRRQILWVAATGVIAALMTCASVQASYWKNSEALWRHTIDCTSKNAFACNNLGSALAAEGRNEEAISNYMIAAGMNPDSAEIYYNLGVALVATGRPAEGTKSYQKALELDPRYAEADNNLGTVLAMQGRLAEATSYFKTAVKIKPDYAEAQYNLALALTAQNRLTEAAEHFRSTLRLRPGFAEASNNLGAVLLKQGLVAEAHDAFKKAVQWKPAYLDAQYNLAYSLSLLGNTNEAIQQYRAILQAKPDYEDAKRQLQLLESH